MTAHRNGRWCECVVVDLNTQHDFCLADGAHPVAGVEEVTREWRRVVAWARRNGVPVISSVESRRSYEPPSNGDPAYCIDGTFGQAKVPFTLFPSRARVEVDNTLNCPVELFNQFQQVILRKRADDLLTNPKADRLFSQLHAREFILFGAGTERSIKSLALGLLARGKNVSVALDACGFWSRSAADLAVRQMAAKGAQLISTSELMGRKLERRYRYRALLPEVKQPSANGHNGVARTTAAGNGKESGDSNRRSRRRMLRDTGSKPARSRLSGGRSRSRIPKADGHPTGPETK